MKVVKKSKGSSSVKLLHKVIILIFLSFLGYGEKNKMVAAAGMNKKLASVLMENKQQQQKKLLQVEQRKNGKHSIDDNLFSSSKRRVPNASDPLHNR